MSVEGSVRERRRAETIQEIKDAALDQLAEAGPGGLSLRGVARAVGMTVQSLYHYFDSRDALLVALVSDAHHALADAAQAAAEATRGRPPAERQLATTGAYRRWALANRPAFLLLYGTPVPGFEPPPGAIGPAARRLADPFLDVVFDGFTPAQLEAVRASRRCGGTARVDGVGPPAARRARPVPRDARAHARAGHAGAARTPAPVAGLRRRRCSPARCSGWPTSWRRCARRDQPFLPAR